MEENEDVNVESQKISHRLCDLPWECALQIGASYDIHRATQVE